MSPFPHYFDGVVPEFTIPMRGNEAGFNARAAAHRRAVYNPHEG